MALRNALTDRLRAHRPIDGEARLYLSSEDRYYFTAALLAAATLDITVELGPPRSSPNQTLAATRAERSPGELSLQDADVTALDLVVMREPMEVSAPLAFDLSALRVAFWTSGSQAEPRRWEKSASALLAEACMLREFWNLGRGERVVCAAPPHHIYGFLWGVLLPLVSQASVFRGRARHAAAIEEALEASQAKRLVAVPAQLAALNSANRVTDSAGQLVRGQVISSGAPLDPTLAQELEGLGWSVTEILGSTETGGIAFRAPAHQEKFEALPGVSLTTSPEGLLVVTSPYADPPETPKLTADRVKFEGRLFRHLGRMDGTVKIGANRISLEEVAERARSVSGIREARALVVAAADSQAHETDLALVAVAPGLSKSAVKEALYRELPQEFWPKRVRLVDSMPVDERGKTTLRLLEALFNRAVPLQLTPLSSDAAGLSAEYELFVPPEASCLSGHFPESPVVPAAVLLGDAIVDPARASWPGLPTSSALRAVRFLAPLRAGETAHVQLIRSQRQVDFRVKRGNETLVSGSVLFTEELGAAKDRNPA